MQDCFSPPMNLPPLPSAVVGYDLRLVRGGYWRTRDVTGREQGIDKAAVSRIARACPSIFFGHSRNILRSWTCDEERLAGEKPSPPGACDRLHFARRIFGALAERYLLIARRFRLAKVF